MHTIRTAGGSFHEIWRTRYREPYRSRLTCWRTVGCSSTTRLLHPIILEVATLGDLSKLYKNIGHQLPAKSKIANKFGLSIHSNLASWLEAIAYLPNIIAHHSRLWSHNMVKRPSEPLNPRNTWLSQQLSDLEAKRPFYIITAMLYLCDAVKPNNGLREDIHQFLKKYCHLPVQRMGFFTGWEQEPIWVLGECQSS